MRQSQSAVRRWLAACLLVSSVSACGLGADAETRIERAMAHRADGDFRSAVIELRNVLQSEPSNVEARTLLGQVAGTLGDAPTASKELGRARDLGADADDYLLPLCRALLAQRRYDDVLAELQRTPVTALSDEGERAELIVVRGLARLGRDELDAAATDFRAALERVPGLVSARLGQARLTAARGDPAGAERLAAAIVADDPSSHGAWGLMGDIASRSGRLDEAAEHYRQAVERAPGVALRLERFTYLGSLADVLLSSGQLDEARAAIEQLRRTSPGHPLGELLSAQLDFQQGELQPALTKLQELAASRPDYLRARQLLGAVALADGDLPLAELSLRAVVAGAPEQVEPRKLLARVLLRMERPDEVARVLQPLVDAGTADAQVLAMLGTATAALGDRAGAIALFERGAAESGEAFEQIELATGYLLAGEVDRAIEFLEAVPDDGAPGIRRELLLVLANLTKGDPQGARSEVERVLAERPEDPRAHMLAASFHVSVRDLDAARAAYEQALEIDREYRAALLGLVRLDVFSGELEAGEARLDEALERNPGDLTLLMNKARIAEQLGDGARALSLVEQARESNEQAALPLLFLARNQLRRGEIEAALELATEATQLEPSNGQAHYVLGWARLEDGRASEAIASLERALQLAPRLIEARYQLARAQAKTGLQGAAKQTIGALLERAPDHLRGRMVMAQMEARDGNAEEAMELVDGLVAEHPDEASVRKLAGDVNLLLEEPELARRWFDEAYDLAPSQELAVKRYEASVAAGDDGAAEEALRGRLAEDPEDLGIHMLLAEHLQGSSPEAAMDEYRKIIDKAPNHAPSRNNYAWLLAQDGQLAVALEQAERAHRLQPQVPAITDTYGWLLVQSGDVAAGLRLLREANRLLPNDPDVGYHLAVALERSGDSDQARLLLRQALAADNDFYSRSEAEALLERLN